MGALSIGKVHKDSLENLVGLPIDKNAGRVGRARAVKHVANSLTGKKLNITGHKLVIKKLLNTKHGSKLLLKSWKKTLTQALMLLQS